MRPWIVTALAMLLLGCVPAEPPAASAGAAPLVPASGSPGATAFRQVSEQSISPLPVTADTASYGVARRLIRAGQAPPPAQIRPDEFLQAFGFSYPDNFSRPFVSLVPAPWDANRRLLHIGIRAPDGPRERPPLNLVFLIDSSASMAPADRLPVIQGAIRALLPSLTERDRISILTYGAGSRTLLDAMRGDRRLFIETALDDLRPGGNQPGANAIETAYALAAKNRAPGAINRVILAGDGDLEMGVPAAALEPLVRAQQARGIQLTSLGVGLDNVGDGRIRALARAGNGRHAHAATKADAARFLAEEFRLNLTAVGTEVTVEVEFNGLRLSAWRLIGSEGAGGTPPPVTLGTGRAFTALYELNSTDNFSTALDPRAYGRDNPSAPGEAEGTQYATVRIRYSPPGGGEQQVITRRVGERDAPRSFAAAPADSRFAAAVAGFALRLRREPLNWPMAEIATAAQAAIGDNPGGQRPDFVALVRSAANLPAYR